MAQGVLETIVQMFQNIYEDLIGLLPTSFFGKNLQNEIDVIIHSVITMVLVLLVFKLMFGKSSTATGKVVLISVFVIIYLVLQIWVL